MNGCKDVMLMQRLLEDAANEALFAYETLPLRERMLNRLSDLMFCADDVLQMIQPIALWRTAKFLSAAHTTASTRS